jgi:hypothetical protein
MCNSTLLCTFRSIPLVKSHGGAGLPDGVCICIPKIPIWVNFGGPWNGKCWYILWPLAYFVTIWCILPNFGIFYQEKSGNLVVEAHEYSDRASVIPSSPAKLAHQIEEHKNMH